jgi:hypothetical protein
MRNIKEIKAEMSALRAAYEAKILELNDEINSVRKARGFVSAREREVADYYEQGRSEARNHSGSLQY